MGMSFFAELKRRNVFKVGAAYAIVAWLLIQVASIIFPAYQAPGWVMPIFVTLISLGFPIAVFLAWAYELTPEGIKVTTSEGPDQYHTQTTGQRLNYFIMSVLVLAVAFILLDNYVLVHIGETATVSSVATTNTGGIDTAAGESTPEPAVSSDSVQVRRTFLGLGQTQGLIPFGVQAFLALSRDGGQLVYVLNKKGIEQLYHRQLKQLTAHVIPDIFQPRNLCISPDGEWVGTTNLDVGLFKVALQGSKPQQLVAQIISLAGCFWAKDNMIYFTMNNKLHRIPAGGGKPEAVRITSEYSEWTQAWPYGLPDGKHLLLTVSQGNANAGHIVLLSLETGDTRILIQNAYNARYVPTGHIVFMRSGSLWAVPFDMKQLKVTGLEVAVIDGVETHTTTGIAGYTFSDDGLLVYLPGDELTGVMGGSRQLDLEWVDRKGNETRIDELQLSSDFAAPRLSPDGRQVAVGVSGQSGTDIWTYDFERGTFSRRTFSGNAVYAIWTPDGQRLVYSSVPPEFGLYWTRADGSGQPESLLKSKSFFAPYSFTPDMSQLVTIKSAGQTSFDIHILSMTGGHTEQPLLATELIETQPDLSADGHWLAYISSETGQTEVYVRPFPDVDNGKWQISTGGT